MGATNRIGRKHTQEWMIIGPLGDVTGLTSQVDKDTFIPAGRADAAITAGTNSDNTGLQLNYRISQITTVGTAGDSVVLPPAKAGMMMVVINQAAANSMDVFPTIGEQINALGTDTAFAMAANKTALFVCAVNGRWNTILTA